MTTQAAVEYPQELMEEAAALFLPQSDITKALEHGDRNAHYLLRQEPVSIDCDQALQMIDGGGQDELIAMLRRMSRIKRLLRDVESVRREGIKRY